jgi:hypothetical protein
VVVGRVSDHPERGKYYVVVDPAVLELIGELTKRHDPAVLPQVQVLLRAAGVDPTSGNLIISVEFLRELATEGGGE